MSARLECKINQQSKTLLASRERQFHAAILNRNEPAFYCVPAKEYEALMNRLEDLELIALCNERENDPTIMVSIDDL